MQILKEQGSVTRGAIAAGDPQTVQAGLQILSRGGNAVDAAVAAAFASFVIEYPLVNIGGSGIATVGDSRTGTFSVYDFFSDMPSGSFTAESDFREVTVDYGPTSQPFYIGRASVAVPGAVAGLSKLAAELGTLPLSTLLEPAVHLAREGVVLSEALANAYQLLLPIFTDTPALAAIYVPGGRPVQISERLRLPRLAATLLQLGQEGADYFYCGGLGRQIVGDQQEHGGLLTATDLANYEVLHAEAIAVEYRNFTVLLPPPSSIGGVLVGFALALLRTFDLDDVRHNSARHIQLLAEVMRQTNIAREAWKKHDAPPTQKIAWFLSDSNVEPYVHRLRASLEGAEREREPAQDPGPASTTQISVADGSGGVVSITTSAGEYAGYVVGDTGVCLNNMLGEIDLHPDGFHQIPAGERLSTMMTPTIVLKDGAPLLAVGSGGANRIRSAVLQTIGNVLDFGMAANDAVNAPRVHFEDDVLQLEGGIASSTAKDLAALGYHVNAWESRHMFFGGAHMVLMRDGCLTPAGDLRRGGATATLP